MTSERVKVIFVGGAGRSGSTLLDRILGQMEGCCSLGEMYHLWRRGVIQDQLCGCGTSFRKCFFWQAVLQEAFTQGEYEDVTGFLQLQNSVSRFRHMPFLLSPSMRTKTFRSDLSRYMNILGRVYKAIVKTSGCNVLIDSSKLPAHGFILSEMPGIELYVIHLVRDSRAVVYSWQRKKLRPEIYWEESYMPRMGIFKSCYEWLLCNSLIGLLSRRAVHYKTLSYEEFTRSPKKKVKELLQWVGISPEPSFFVDDRRAVLGIDHTVSGNPVRFARGTMSIISDMTWRFKMPFLEKFIVSGLTFPFLLRYHQKREEPVKEDN